MYFLVSFFTMNSLGFFCLHVGPHFEIILGPQNNFSEQRPALVINGPCYVIKCISSFCKRSFVVWVNLTFRTFRYCRQQHFRLTGDQVDKRRAWLVPLHIVKSFCLQSSQSIICNRRIKSILEKTDGCTKSPNVSVMCSSVRQYAQVGNIPPISF